MEVWRMLFEALLGMIILILGFFFTNRLSSHKLALTDLDKRVRENEKSMAKDNSALTTLVTTLADHTSKEEVHWQRVGLMSERLVRIESKIPNGEIAKLTLAVMELIKKVDSK